MWRIRAIPEVCIGCGLCRVWCKVEHSDSKNIHKAFKPNAPETISCVELEESGCESFAMQCRQCDEPLCAYGCITGAMTKDPDTGLVTVDKKKCVGCWTCILMCPNGVIKRDERNGRSAIKCDLCKDRGFPSCVEHCPNDALIIEESPMNPLAAHSAPLSGSRSIQGYFCRPRGSSRGDENILFSEEVDDDE